MAFHSYANNLVVGDTNNRYDIFVHDRNSGETARVSAASDGTQGDHNSFYASISADGRFVAFHSYASNLVAGDTNNSFDIFVHDRSSGETERVSVASDGTQGNYGSQFASISADGRFVAFASYARNLVAGDPTIPWDIFVHDRDTGVTERISVAAEGITQGSNHSLYPSNSADGRFVVFHSYASNLVADDTNGVADVFLRDRQDGTTERISVAADGNQSDGNSYFPSVTGDGRHVAYLSNGTNVVAEGTNGYAQVFVLDRITNTAPTADAGPHQTVACTALAGTDVTLDGSGSSDPEGDPLTHVWTGPFGTASGVSPTV